MNFVDQALISVQAGRGGNGCRSTYKDLWTRHPIPDGGNGGRGGHVILQANPQLTTLLDFQTRRNFRGQPGRHGSSKKQHGAQGKDCVIDLPLGTVVRDAKTGDLVRELLQPGEQVVVARGGGSGVGNASQKRTGRSVRGEPPKGGFDPSRMQGQPGESRQLQLELKLLADVGIVGLPNAGKSTLISRISQARPKIAPFPFTTLHPVLGVVSRADHSPFVAVDVPGLIEGAHRGKGLGLEFLRHIERTRLLVLLIDMAGVDARDPVEDYRTLKEELKAYGANLSDKPAILVANKMDRSEAKENLSRFQKKLKVRPVPVSAESGAGVSALLGKISKQLERLKKNE